jgi:hypothetical protein
MSIGYRLTFLKAFLLELCALLRRNLFSFPLYSNTSKKNPLSEVISLRGPMGRHEFF